MTAFFLPLPYLAVILQAAWIPRRTLKRFVLVIGGSSLCWFKTIFFLAPLIIPEHFVDSTFKAVLVGAFLLFYPGLLLLNELVDFWRDLF